MSTILSFFLARLAEPSTYAGLSSLLAIFHVTVSSDLVSAISTFGAALAGIIAVVLPQAK